MSNTPLRREDLGEYFRSFESARGEFRIGAENEKFGVHEGSGKPLGYGGDFSVCQVLGYLEAHHGWTPLREVEGGPVLGLSRNSASITLEPSAQLELSGEPLSDLHEVAAEKRTHLTEIAPISKEMGIAWLGTGFHPLATREELPWVPKQRYPIMREYLPRMGTGGLDMMQRTATVQGNFDWCDEADGMRKMVVSLKMSPLVQAWFSNAPFSEGKAHGALSARGNVWRHMDPSRSGLIRPLWEKPNPTYQDYADWAAQAGMFLFKRDGAIVHNTGQPFTDFMENGFEGHRATLADWKLHVTTLFPEVRLKNTLEVRAVDGLPPELALASLAVWTGVLYDDEALGAAEQLLSEITFDGMEAARPALVERGLHAAVAGRDGFQWAQRLHEIAHGGLERRDRKNASGASELIYLQGAAEIVSSRKHPADRALARYRESGSLIEATRIVI